MRITSSPQISRVIIVISKSIMIISNLIISQIILCHDYMQFVYIVWKLVNKVPEHKAIHGALSKRFLTSDLDTKKNITKLLTTCELNIFSHQHIPPCYSVYMATPQILHDCQTFSNIGKSERKYQTYNVPCRERSLNSCSYA